MKRTVLSMLLLLVISASTIAAERTTKPSDSSAFVMEYLSWKTRFHMSAFTPWEDRANNERAQGNDCLTHILFLGMIGSWHMPITSLDNKKLMDQYVDSMRNFKEMCDTGMRK